MVKTSWFISNTMLFSQPTQFPKGSPREDIPQLFFNTGKRKPDSMLDFQQHGNPNIHAHNYAIIANRPTGAIIP